MSIVSYEGDVVAWANQQAGFIRHKQFALLDLEHLAEEIEDVGKSEQRELASRMAVLLQHLLKWQYQPERQGKSWQLTIKEQRRALTLCLKKMPSLKHTLKDTDWWVVVWLDARMGAEKETGISFDQYPEQCPWTAEQILDDAWLPSLYERG